MDHTSGCKSREASWHEHQADLIINSLHCGDSAGTIAFAREIAGHHREHAAALRAHGALANEEKSDAANAVPTGRF